MPDKFRSARAITPSTDILVPSETRSTPLSYRNSVGANCFLSYSRTDAGCAKQIKAGLEISKLDCFHDVDAVRGGDEVYQTIGDGIEYSDFFIPILSEDSLKSPWVQDEIRLALHYYRKNGAPIIIPVQICDIEKIVSWELQGDDIGAKIRSKNMVKMIECDNAKDQVAPLINALFAHSKGMVGE